MEDLKPMIDGKTITCLVSEVVPRTGAKGGQYWVVKAEFQDPAFADLEGQYAKANAFQPMEKGRSYPLTFEFGTGKLPIAKRPPSTEEERAARKAREEQEKADYEKEMGRAGGDPQGGANLVTTERYTLLAGRFGFTTDDVRLMEQNQIVPKETPVTQVEFFFRTAQLMSLNPLLKQVYLLPFGFGAKKGYAIVVAIDSMRSKAIATGQYGGKSKVLFDGLTMAEWIRTYNNRREYEVKEIPRKSGTKEWKESEYHLKSGDFPQTASVVVTRIVNGIPCQFEAEIAWDEYYPGPSGRGQMWRDRPFGQLGKCCEAIALRQAFSDALSKHYVSEEMDRKAAESEVVDAPHLDWDTILREISACSSKDEVLRYKAGKPELANDGEFAEAIQLKLEEIERS